MRAYFPVGIWYDWYTGKAIQSSGFTVELPAPADKINLHTRGGSILPVQDPALTTMETLDIYMIIYRLVPIFSVD